MAGDSVIYSASDLASAARCEYALLREFDAKLGWGQRVTVTDELLERTAILGDEHEQRRLDQLRDEHGGGVAVIGRPAPFTVENVTAAAAQTRRKIEDGAPVIYQAAMFDGRFVGFADFLVLRDGKYQVSDTKLARSAKVTALLQLAAYADALSQAGVPVHPGAELILGNGTAVSYQVDELVPVYREQRARLQRLLDDHYAHGAPVRWEDDGVRACFRCPVCEEQVRATDDLLLVAGLRVSQRAKLIDAGITTVADLAEHTGPVADMSARSMTTLVAQARLQIARARHRHTTVRGRRPAAADPAPQPRRGRSVLRLRGRSAVDRRRRRLGSGVSVRCSRRRQGGRLSSAVGARPPRRAQSTHRLPRTGGQAAQAVSQHAHLSLRRIREDGAATSGRAPWRRRRRSRRFAAQRDAGRPVSDCAQEHSDRQRIAQPQGVGAALHGITAAVGRRHDGHRLDHTICALQRTARGRRPRPGGSRAQGDRRTTTSTTANPPASSAIGWSSGHSKTA